MLNKVPNNSPERSTLEATDIDNLLSKTLIANLGTTNDDGSIHLIPMWFIRIDNYICIPTSRKTHKYRNLRARPHAAVMIDISLQGLNLKGVLINGLVDLVEGEEARKINHLIHLKYLLPEALNHEAVAHYLSHGDDITIKVNIEHMVSWNLADSKAGKALHSGGLARRHDTNL